MTPVELITFARQKYNATIDTFWSDVELYSLVYAAQMHLALETRCIRNVYTSTTVVGQQEYQRPTTAISIKRITYNGSKLFKITDREDDSLTLNNQTTSAMGSPQYYWEWGTALELRPVPDDTLTLTIYSFDAPNVVAANTVLDVPTRYHPDLAEYVLAQMAGKDKNYQAAAWYQQQWTAKVADAKRYERSLLRGDAFSHVTNEDSVPKTILGSL